MRSERAPTSVAPLNEVTSSLSSEVSATLTLPLSAREARVARWFSRPEFHLPASRGSLAARRVRGRPAAVPIVPGSQYRHQEPKAGQPISDQLQTTAHHRWNPRLFARAAGIALWSASEILALEGSPEPEVIISWTENGSPSDSPLVSHGGGGDSMWISKTTARSPARLDRRKSDDRTGTGCDFSSGRRMGCQ